MALTDTYDFEFLVNEVEKFVFDELEKQLAAYPKPESAPAPALESTTEPPPETAPAPESAAEPPPETASEPDTHMDAPPEPPPEPDEEPDADALSLCLCNDCVADMAAMALNSIKPMYRYSLLGSLYMSQAISDEAFAANIKDTVAKAIEKVRLNPSHG
ncbi:MAG: late competence development ComFB family protein [Treponema sp.]|jgi:hypothetical protein|nr:late competence development ComFB family protein [Treponema sp.]